MLKMEEASRTKRVPAQTTLGSDQPDPTSLQSYGAFAIALTLVLLSLVVGLLGRGQGPAIEPLIPLTAGIWSLADLLTAFLLLAQFYVNGRRFFSLLAVAYAFTGVLTWPYLAAFPGLFKTSGVTVGDEQTSIYLWSIWHCAFPLFVICATINDSALGRFVSRRAIRTVAGVSIALPLVGGIVIAALVYAQRNALPQLVIHGAFEPLFRTLVVPPLIALNGIACIVLLRPRLLTPLRLWLALAVFSAALDASLNVCGDKYSYTWDASKLITVFTAGVVLFMMLFDIAGLYGRLARIANIDVLTSLSNRRAFEDHFSLAFESACGLGRSLGILVIDIDFFKRFNDANGHLAGDECLRRVARAIDACVTRPLDLVARYGGEEFVVVLPDTPLQGMLVLAERIRSEVQQLEVIYLTKALARVTVSVGVGYAAEANAVTRAVLFEAADRALYAAKAGGRNRIVVRDPVAEADEPLPVPSAATLGLENL